MPSSTLSKSALHATPPKLGARKEATLTNETTELFVLHEKARSKTLEALEICQCPVTRIFLMSIEDCHCRAAKSFEEETSILAFPTPTDSIPGSSVEIDGEKKWRSKFQKILAKLKKMESELIERHLQQSQNNAIPGFRESNALIVSHLERNLWGLQQVEKSLP